MAQTPTETARLACIGREYADTCDKCPAKTTIMLGKERSLCKGRFAAEEGSIVSLFARWRRAHPAVTPAGPDA